MEILAPELFDRKDIQDGLDIIKQADPFASKLHEEFNNIFPDKMNGKVVFYALAMFVAPIMHAFIRDNSNPELLDDFKDNVSHFIQMLENNKSKAQ